MVDKMLILAWRDGGCETVSLKRMKFQEIQPYARCGPFEARAADSRQYDYYDRIGLKGCNL